MDWKEGDLRPVKLKQTKRSRGKSRPKTVETPYKLPPPYHRLVSQLVCEIDFADSYYTHEAHRRQAYAEEVLDAFGWELNGLKSTTDPAMMAFRSIVLTPILQRQLFGISDAYTPYVRSTILGDDDDTEPTIEDVDTKLTIEVVTKFYLGEDPIDPVNIPTYRRNLIYLPEARWHLGLTMKVLGETPEPKALGLYFSKIQDHHDIIMKALQDNEIKYDDDGFPLLSHAERSAIIEEQLELFFAEELARPVRHILLLAPLCPPIIDNITPRICPRQPQPLGHRRNPHRNPHNQHSQNSHNRILRNQYPHNQILCNRSDPTMRKFPLSHVQYPK